MKNLANLMKQAQEMQGKMAQLQEDLENAEVTGEAAGGKVVVTLNGKGVVKNIDITDKTIIDPNDSEVMLDLITAALNNGREKLNDLVQAKTKDVMSGVQLPEGMNLPV